MTNKWNVPVLMIVLLCSGGVWAASSAVPDAFAEMDLVWERRLGIHQYTVPVLQNGYLFVGVDDKALQHPAVKSTGGGLLMCLEPDSAEVVWQMPIPRNMEGTKPPFHFNHWKCGVCSRPAFDGDRLYIVGPRGDILCLDRQGQADGNTGPFLTEVNYMKATPDYQLQETDGDIIWRYDLIKELGVVPHDVCGSSPVVLGDFVYANTGNGQDDKHRAVANPEAPSLIVLDKTSGKLVATDGGLFGERLFHGNWSSPMAVTFKGKTMILFSGGDGIMYAFKPIAQAAEKPQPLEIIWQYDCNPPDYRMRDGQPIPCSMWNKKRVDGPSEIVASPVIYQDRLFVAIGQSPLHGPGQGHLCCIDGATGKKVWATRKVDRTLATAVIDKDLLYICDFSGNLFCIETATGDVVWQHDMEAGAWTASPFVLGDKVIVSTEKQVLWVLKTGRAKEVLSRSRLKSPAITPVVYDGVMYFPTQKRLLALKVADG
ncbi:PQQ-binding-like beta-propeller repeat protein [Planctomycetota bacterium]